MTKKLKFLVVSYLLVNAVVIGVMSAVIFGGPLENMVHPVITQRSENRDEISRTATEGCWTWDVKKARQGDLLDIDAVVDNHGDLTFPEVYDHATHKPVHSRGAALPGQRHVDFCIQLPPDLLPSDPFVMHAKIRYQGATPLWSLVYDMPDVVFPPVPPTP